MSLSFNDFFLILNVYLNIPQYEDQYVNLENINDPLEAIRGKYNTIPVFWQFYNSNLEINFLSKSFQRKKFKDNSYPVSILPNLSKIFERYLYKQFL